MRVKHLDSPVVGCRREEWVGRVEGERAQSTCVVPVVFQESGIFHSTVVREGYTPKDFVRLLA